MGINVEHNVDPSLLGQAGLAIGQGERQQDALRTLASLGRYGQQQPQSISLQAPHHQSVWEMDHPGGFATPTTGPSIYGTGADDTRPEGAPTEYQQENQPPPAYDDASQARLSELQQKHHMVETSDNLTPEQKLDAHQQLDGQFALGAKYKPLQSKKSFKDTISENSVTLPNGDMLVGTPDGKTVHIKASDVNKAGPLPAGDASMVQGPPSPMPADQAPIDPNDPATMQGQDTSDPSQPHTIEDEQNVVKGADGALYAKNTDKNGQVHFKKIDAAPKPTPAAKPAKDELSAAEFHKEYLQARKELTKTIPDETAPDGVRTQVPSKEEILAHIKDVLDMHRQLTGRSTLGAQSNKAIPAAGGPSPDDLDAASAAGQLPHPDAPHEDKAAAYDKQYARMQADPRFAELGPVGKNIVAKKLHDAIFGASQ